MPTVLLPTRVTSHSCTLIDHTREITSFVIQKHSKKTSCIEIFSLTYLIILQILLSWIQKLEKNREIKDQMSEVLVRKARKILKRA